MTGAFYKYDVRLKRENFPKDLAEGKEYERLWVEQATGDHEVKCDKLTYKTGNVFIEVSDAGKPSGIMKTEAKNYAIGLAHPKRTFTLWILIPTRLLKQIMVDYKQVSGGDNMEARGYLIPVERLLNFHLLHDKE